MFLQRILPLSPAVSCAVLAALAAARATPAEPDARSRSILTPFAQARSLEIGSVRLSRSEVPVHDLLEVMVDVSATYNNPFAAWDAALDLHVIPPSRKSYVVPGFLYQDYRSASRDGREELAPSGPPVWKARVAPKEPGIHQVMLRFRTTGGSAASAPVQFTATAAKTPGFARVSTADPRYFELSNGRSYYPIGTDNTPDTAADTNYNIWFAQLSRHGANHARLRLSPPGSSLAMESMGAPAAGRGFGLFNPENAWRLDQVLLAARRHGIRLTLCIDTPALLTPNGRGWAGSLLNVKNGGPLRSPAAFWSDTALSTHYDSKLRYLVARYGAFPEVFAWELWQDAETAEGFQIPAARIWHERRITAFRQLDTHGHLITTRFARPNGIPEIDALDGVQLVQTQAPAGAVPSRAVIEAHARKRAYKKPHIVTLATGDNAVNGATTGSEEAFRFAPLWAGVAAGVSGVAVSPLATAGAMQTGDYAALHALSAFTRGIDWPREQFRPMTPRFEWVKRPETLPRTDVVVPNAEAPDGASTSGAAPARTRTVEITRAGASGQLPVPSRLHGIVNQADEPRQLAFDVDLPWPTRLEVKVGEVSGDGGAILKITVDGQTALERDFVDVEPGKQPLTRYAGSYSAPIAAGRKRVVVENIGKDWMQAEIRFLNAREGTGPELEAWGSAGSTTALAWVRVNRDTSGSSEAPSTKALEAFALLPGLAPGRWNAELWDPATGKIRSTTPVQVNETGTARVRIPAAGSDFALRLRKR